MTEVPVLLAVAASAVALVGAGLAVAGWRALRGRRWSLGAVGSLAGLMLLLLGVLGWGVVLGTRGYRALTREELAARVEVEPLAEQSFRAVVRARGAPPDTFRLAGDQLYVDARVLKWHPWVNLLGVHTAYRLTRIGGRYRSIEDERTRERTVYALSEQGPVEFFRVAEALPALSRLVDAVYGSASFVPADSPRTFEVRVSTSGLLIRARPDSTPVSVLTPRGSSRLPAGGSAGPS